MPLNHFPPTKTKRAATSPPSHNLSAQLLDTKPVQSTARRQPKVRLHLPTKCKNPSKK